MFLVSLFYFYIFLLCVDIKLFAKIVEVSIQSYLPKWNFILKLNYYGVQCNFLVFSLAVFIFLLVANYRFGVLMVETLECWFTHQNSKLQFQFQLVLFILYWNIKPYLYFKKKNWVWIGISNVPSAWNINHNLSTSD